MGICERCKGRRVIAIRPRVYARCPDCSPNVTDENSRIQARARLHECARKYHLGQTGNENLYSAVHHAEYFYSASEIGAIADLSVQDVHRVLQRIIPFTGRYQRKHHGRPTVGAYGRPIPGTDRGSPDAA